MGKIFTCFQSKMVQNQYPLGWHIPRYGLYKRRLSWLTCFKIRGSREIIVCSGLAWWVNTCTSELKQFAKKVVSDIRGLVGFANGQVNSRFASEVFLGEIQITEEL